MKIKKVPQNNLTAAVALLSPYAPELSASSLIDALESYQRNIPNKPRLLSKHEAAARLGVSWFTLIRWAKAGDIEALKVGKLWKFRADEIERFANGGAR